MNHEEHVEDRFSDLHDGLLDEPGRRAVLHHLAACWACRTGYEAFERATGALRALRLAPTPGAHVDEVLAAVLAPPAPRARRIGLLLSHAAALVLGLGLALGLRGCGAGDDATATGDRVVEVVREVPVEVPVEVVWEVPVEVRVEVVREVQIERIEYVDRPVPNPLQAEAEFGLRFLADVGGALSQVARAARAAAARDAAAMARVAELATVARGVAAAGATEKPPSTPRASAVRQERGGAPLRILRTDDRVRIRTRGALATVVPALIETLDDEDPDVARAAEQHLEALRAGLEGDVAAPPGPGALTAGEAARPGGLRALLASSRGAPEDESDPGPRERWQRWWLERSLALADGATL